MSLKIVWANLNSLSNQLILSVFSISGFFYLCLMSSCGREQGTGFIFLYNTLGRLLVESHLATLQLSQPLWNIISEINQLHTWFTDKESIALHFKLQTILTNSVVRCFFKSTQHILGGQEGRLGGVHHWEGLGRGIIFTPEQNCRESSYLNIQKTNFFPIQNTVSHRTADCLVRINGLLWRKTMPAHFQLASTEKQIFFLS